MKSLVPGNTRAAFAIGLALMLHPGALHAQDSDAMQRVQERAKYLSDFKALLSHSDSSIRTAAVQEALSGSDVDIRSMALESALASDDEKLQTSALRWILSNRSTLSVKLELPDSPSKAQDYAYNELHGMVLNELKLNPQSDEIRFRHTYFREAHLLRGGIEFTLYAPRRYTCVTTVKPAGGMMLAGAVACTVEAGVLEKGDRQTRRASLPVRIDLS